MRIWQSLAGLVLAGLLEACGGGSTPPSPVAAVLAVVREPSSDGQSGILLPRQPVIELRDARGEPVATRGVQVTAAIATGGGTLGGTVAGRTDAQGRVQYADLVITGAAGPRTLQFSASGLTSALSAEVLLRAGDPGVLLPAAGNNQTAPAGTRVAVAPAVRVNDGAGNPVPGAVVAFAVTEGGGSVDGGTVATGADGVARVTSWTLGPAVGPNALTASVGSIQLVFQATGIVGPAAKIVLQEGDGQTAVIGNPVPLAPAVKVTDAYDNPIAGVTVTFAVGSGGGAVTGANSTTDASGLARVGAWTLGVIPGSQTLTAARTGVPSLSIAATATDYQITDLAAGGMSSCAIGADGGPRCWGSNASGQLGNGVTGATNLPSPLTGSLQLRSITVGASHGCGLSATGVAYCWGANQVGQLGDGSNSSRPTPVAVSGGQTFSQIVVGDLHSCALDIVGSAWCWGSNANGRLGDNTTSASSNVPKAVQGGYLFTRIAATAAHSCGLRSDGQILCWGANANGRLGDGTTADRRAPTAVLAPPAAAAFDAVAAGGSHSCAVDRNGAAFCWGLGTQGALGTGNTISQTTPTAVTGGLTFKAIAAGQSHTCGIAVTDVLYCWGANGSGRLGDGTTATRTSPTVVKGSLPATDVRLGGEHTCVRSTYGSALCWGRGLEGQVGDGANLARSAPTGVTPP